MEDRLEHQRWLEAVLSSLPRPLLLSDPRTGEISYANAAAAALQRMLRDPSHPFADPEAPIRRALRGEVIEELQLDWELEGAPASMLLSSCRLPALHGKGEVAIVSALDVTPLRKAESRLQRAVRARDEFMSAASHELNTPLTTIVLQLDSLSRHLRKSGLQDDPKAERALTTLGRNVDRLGRLVAEMLDVSRIGEGHLRLELGDCDLAEVVREVAGRYEEQLTRAGCKLELDVGGPVVGLWDRSRLDQVVTNLLTNALKYAPGTPVTISVSADEGCARCCVRDRGIGIARENQARVFERFERAVPTENYAGMGLGLWIVSRIVAQMGGSVALESELGQGAAFTFTLPREQASGPAVARAVAS
jgi:signal transduction histidine kinase